MGHSGWDIIYDFLDEILASIMPGAYFVSYFVLWFFFFFRENPLSQIGEGALSALFLFAFVLCYCLGTVFRRSDMKKIDRKSAYGIYRAQDRHSGSFAFAENLFPAMKDLMARYDALPEEFSLERLFHSMYAPVGTGFLARARHALTRHRTSAYGRLSRYYKRLKRHLKACGGEEGQALTALCRELEALLFPPVDYPYVHLRNYLAARELSINAYVPWNSETRSKMKTNTYKVEISARAPQMMSILNKNEAHIRFMNSMWYASQSLLYSTLAVGAVSLFLWSLLHRGRADLTLTLLFSEERLIIVLIFSLLYLIAALFVKYSVKKIIHYQRVRELVFLLTTYDEMMRKDAESGRAQSPQATPAP